MTDMNELKESLIKLVNLARSNYNLEFSEKPLKKNVVMVMGDQSSGKSSLVNYLFGDIAVRETGSQAIDTQFTILETVSEHQFIKLVTKQKYKKICQENASKIESFTKNDTSYAWLKEPLQRDNDYRRDLVWTEIGKEEKKKRFGQLYGGHLGKIFTQYDELVKAVVINEKFVRGTELERIKIRAMKEQNIKTQINRKSPSNEMNCNMDGSVIITKTMHSINEHIMDGYVVIPKHAREMEYYPLCMDMIIIDTPGFNDQCVTDMDKFRANIEVLEFFYKQSSLALFLASPTNLLSISDALKMVQLTMLDSDTRNVILDQMKPQEMKQERKENISDESEGLMKTIAISAFRALIPWGNVVDYMWSSRKVLTKGVSNVLDAVMEQKGTEIEASKYKQIGSSVYEKMYFVVNKKDLCLNANSAYFEFGYAIGRSFSHLPPLPSKNVLMIGCPQEQRKQRMSGRDIDMVEAISLDELQFGDMPQLEARLNLLRGDDYKQRCYIHHMHYIYEKMREAHSKLSYYQRTMLYMTDPLEQARKLCGL